MQCAKCGTANHEQAKFCVECGAPLIVCPGCGAVGQAGNKFCGTCGTPLTAQLSTAKTPDPRLQTLNVFLPPLSYTPPHLASRILSDKATLEGERKIVTVLFADIKGSMDILESLDPEEGRRLLDPCLHRMMEAVHRFEGTVNRVLGDGIMALFGAPLALEDHPHRALYAALRMHEAVGLYAAELQERHGITLQIRVGINTGEVVVGTIGNDLHMEYTPVGHAVGLGARMEALATPGSTLVTASTYHLTREYFRFAARDPVKIKGAREPLAVYELLGPGGARSRLAARAARGLTPFVGRSRELTQLHALAALAASGRGQIVSLAGEAGVGKSRLLEEYKAALRTRGYLLIEGATFAYGKTRTYLPLIEMLKHYCGINAQDTQAAYREKLRGALAALDESLTDCVPVFLELLGVDSGDAQTTELSAEARLQHILNGIKRLIALQSRRQPVALLVEDLQWLDARSLAFLQDLTSHLNALPVLLVVSYRPGTRYPWEERSFAHRLHIVPLPRDASAALFTALVGTDPGAATLAPAVCEQSGGNPFFLEELVQGLRETGALIGQSRAYTLAQSPSVWALPATVQGMLASRLDRLPPPLKALLQTAAVIGREVPRPLLARVSGLSEPDLDHALTTLQAREFLSETAVYPDAVYTFKHALTQEVAYHGLLQEHRTVLHTAVGAAVEALYADKLQECSALLAYHYSRSAATDKALHYLDLAGQCAFALYADTDALQFWEERLRLLTTLPASPERDRQEVRTRLHLINVLSRQSSDDGPTRVQFEAAVAACQRLQDSHLLAELHATLAVAYVLWGRPQSGLPHARVAKQLAATLDDVHLRVITPGPLAHLLWIAGRFSEGLQVATEGLDLLRRHGLLQEQMGFVAYPYVQCLAIAGACQGFLGDFDRGLQTLQEAAASARQHGNRIPQALSHWGIALLLALRGEAAAALREADTALAVMQEVGSATGVLLAGCVQEYLAMEAGALPRSAAASLPTPWLTQTWHESRAFCELAGTWLAEVALHAGHRDEALRLARVALTQAEASENAWFLCAAHATLGKILAQPETKEYASAETHLLTALRFAEAMHSRPWCARVTLQLGEVLWRKQREVRSSEFGVRSPESADRMMDGEESVKAYLSRAAELCETLGMQADAARARTLLAQAAH